MPQFHKEDVIIEDRPQGLKHVRLITINRVERRNALNAKVAQKLYEAIENADADSSVRALVLTGAGDKAFCAGADLTGIFSEESSTLEGGTSAFGKLFSVMRHAGVPIVSAVNGFAVGGGFGLVLASDLVVMSKSAYVGTPEIKRGLFAMFISRFIYEVMPEKLANEILYLGQTLTAKEAKLYRIVNKVVSQEDVLPVALEMASQIAEHSGSVLRKGKRAINQQKNLTFDEAMEFLGFKLSENLELHDAKEGILSFFEKRKPNWNDN